MSGLTLKEKMITRSGCLWKFIWRETMSLTLSFEHYEFCCLLQSEQGIRQILYFEHQRCMNICE